jgi:LemA protein
VGSGALGAAVGGLFLLVAIAFVAGLYNSLVRVRTNVRKAWSNIDVLLMQRHAEIPNLVGVVKGCAAHERETLEAVTALRARYDAASGSDLRAVLENQLNALLLPLFARAEAYPNLKADQAFLKLQARLSELENAIAERREYFNDCVAIYNTKILRFPDAVFARRLGFGPHPFLEAPGAERRNPAVGFGTAS